MNSVCGDISISIDIMVTRKLKREAIKYGVPIPDRKDDKMWFEFYNNMKVLSEEGQFKLRRKIRQEKKERIEVYMPYIITIFGFIGAITGLIAIIKY